MYMTLREEIVQQAMNLPPSDRAYVADVLEQSLERGGFTTAEIAAAWAAEIDRRIEGYDRGELSASDMESSLCGVREQMAKHRAGKVNR